MAVIPQKIFRGCAPAVEFFDYPLYFPKPVFRGRSAMDASSSEEETEPDARYIKLATQRDINVQAVKLAPKLDVVESKFKVISEGKPTINAQEAGILCRQLGFAPSQADLAALHYQHAQGLTLSQFQVWSSTTCVQYKAKDTPNELSKFFKIYDTTKSGTLTRQQIRTILGSFGECLTAEELDAILSDLGMTGDEIDYEALVKALLAEPTPP